MTARTCVSVPGALESERKRTTAGQLTQGLGREEKHSALRCPPPPPLPPALHICQTRQEASWLQNPGNSASPLYRIEKGQEGIWDQTASEPALPHLSEILRLFSDMPLPGQIINNIVKLKAPWFIVRSGANLDSLPLPSFVTLGLYFPEP